MIALLESWLLRDAFLLGGATLLVYWFRKLRREGYFALAWRRCMHRREARAAWLVILLYAGFGFADWLRVPPEWSGDELFARSPVDLLFAGVEKERTYSAPFAERVVLGAGEDPQAPENQVRGWHPLGTDVNGYDVLYQTVKGSSTALALVSGAMLVSFPLGFLLGLLAGYYGGRTDDAIQWLYTTLASIPWLLFVLAFLIVFGRSLFWIALAFGLTGWVELARLIRGETLRLRESGYLRAARSAGASDLRILLRHLAPNLSHIYIIAFTLQASAIILAESVLTFIGVGVEPGQASWGLMLVEAQTELVRSPPIWWVFVGASFLGIFPIALALNVFGDALRDALDPRLAEISQPAMQD